MVKSAVARATEFEPIDRLEDKIKTLVSLVSKLRADHLRATEENARLTQELAALRARLSESESTADELATLRGERDVIRKRVNELLEQLEHLSL